MKGSGLLKVDLDDGSFEILVSSRRIPALSSLDGRDFGTPVDVFEGRNERLSLQVGDCLYELKMGTQQWDRWPPNKDSHVRGLAFLPAIDGALGMHGDTPPSAFGPDREGPFREIFLAPANCAQFELLLSTPDPVKALRKEMPNLSPRWSCPMALSLLDLRLSGREPLVAYGEGRLWLVARARAQWMRETFKRDIPDTLVLYRFTQGASEPSVTALRFYTPGSDPHEGVLAGGDPAYVGRMIVTRNGLVFVCRPRFGFWVLPFAEIKQP